jgi:hypothetical protein
LLHTLTGSAGKALLTKKYFPPARKSTLMKNSNRIKIITFRVTQDEYAQIANAALAADDEPNSWCRNVALSSSNKPQIAIDNRAIYSEIACLHFLFGHAFRVIFETDPEKHTYWKLMTEYADQKADTMYGNLLRQRLQRKPK